MKKTNNIVITIILVVCLLPSLAFATREYVGTKANIFAKIALGARQAGMAEAFTGLADDVYALDYNIAGLSFRRYNGEPFTRAEIATSVNKWIADDVYFGFLGYANTWNEYKSSVGFAFKTFYEGEIEGRDNDGDLTGEVYKTVDFMGDLGYSYRLLENLSFGVGGEFVYINCW